MELNFGCLPLYRRGKEIPVLPKNFSKVLQDADISLHPMVAVMQRAMPISCKPACAWASTHPIVCPCLQFLPCVASIIQCQPPPYQDGPLGFIGLNSLPNSLYFGLKNQNNQITNLFYKFTKIPNLIYKTNKVWGCGKQK